MKKLFKNLFKRVKHKARFSIKRKFINLKKVVLAYIIHDLVHLPARTRTRTSRGRDMPSRNDFAVSNLKLLLYTVR